MLHYEGNKWVTYTVVLFVSNSLGRPKRKYSHNSSTSDQENATVSLAVSEQPKQIAAYLKIQ